MKRANLIGCVVLSILFISPVMTWAGSCPEGQKENDRTGECVPIKGAAKTKKSLSSGSGWRFKRSLPIGAKKHGYQVVSAPEHPVRYGKKSERFEVRPGDCSRSKGGSWDDCKEDRERSELIQVGYRQKEGDEYWYRWSIILPSTHRNIYRTKLAYAQFHQLGCPPVFMFQEYSGGYWLNIQPAITGHVDHNRKLLEAKDFIGKWNDIVVHARWTRKNDGWFRVWVNGEEKISYDGKTKVCKDVYFKYGVYRSFVSRNRELSKTVTTIAYYDGVVRSKSKEGMFDPLPE
ncbi:MAG: heparin lyase I family protein [Arenicellales bacterium]|nr:heparin lyase I family protein [Arenicellales bacterium]